MTMKEQFKKNLEVFQSLDENTNVTDYFVVALTESSTSSTKGIIQVYNGTDMARLSGTVDILNLELKTTCMLKLDEKIKLIPDVPDNQSEIDPKIIHLLSTVSKKLQ